MNMSEEKQKRYLDQLTNNQKKIDSIGNQFPLFASTNKQVEKYWVIFISTHVFGFECF